MDAGTAPHLTSEELAVLRHAVLFTAIRETAAAAPGRGIWRRFLEPSVIVALITVIGGGIVGGYLTTKLQLHSKERELAVATFRMRSESRLKAVTEAFDFVGDVTSATQDLAVAGVMTDWPKTQVDEIVVKHNSAYDQWRSRHGRIGLQLVYHYGGDSAVQESWQELSRAVDGHFRCAQAQFYTKKPLQTEEQPCTLETRKIDRALSKLSAALLHYENESESEQRAPNSR